MKSKIPAFTIVEMLISLIIASVLLALAWNVFYFTNHYRNLIEFKASKINQIKKVEYYLTNDLSGSRTLILDKDVLHVYRQKDTISYRFSDQWTIRKTNDVTDSLDIGAYIFMQGEEDYRVCLITPEYCFSLSKEASSDSKINKVKDENF